VDGEAAILLRNRWKMTEWVSAFGRKEVHGKVVLLPARISLGGRWEKSEKKASNFPNLPREGLGRLRMKETIKMLKQRTPRGAEAIEIDTTDGKYMRAHKSNPSGTTSGAMEGV